MFSAQRKKCGSVRCGSACTYVSSKNIFQVHFINTTTNTHIRTSCGNTTHTKATASEQAGRSQEGITAESAKDAGGGMDFFPVAPAPSAGANTAKRGLNIEANDLGELARAGDGESRTSADKSEKDVSAPPPAENTSSSTSAAEPVTKARTPQDEVGEELQEEEGDAVARRGDLELCKRKEASGEGFKFTKRAMDGAAAAGHLEMVKWLHGKDEECTTDAMDGAAEEGQLDVVKWLHENRSEGCSLSALAMAAGRGHLKVVQWFYENSVPGDISKAISDANDDGHGEVVEWLRSHSSNKKLRVEGRAGSAAGAACPPRFTRSAPVSAHSSPAPTVVGMFGSPFGNFTPVNGIVLPGATAQAMGPGQAATGVKPPAGGAAGAPRLRGNMLRSPELTLATSGRLSANDERQLKAVMEFRKAYSAQALEGSNIPKDPFTLFAVWFEEARIARASEPGAMCLSTVGPTGRPSARYVMLQGFDKRGFVWYTNFESRKSQEMAHNPYGALSFWWSEVQRAVRIEGVVIKVSEKESVEYFQSRPRGSQVGAWALHQSRPVESRGSLETNVKEVQKKFSLVREVPRPLHFGGFRLRPDRIEFWKGRQTRIHDRIVYVIMDDKWIMQRLQP